MNAETARKQELPVASPISEDERALDRVHAAEALLPAAAAASSLRSFYTALYRGAPPGDITRYTPESLVALAVLAFENTNKRNPGETSVEVFPFRSDVEGGGERNETILVGVNDD